MILSSGGRNKKVEQVSLLYRSSQLAVRSRTPSRVLHGLFSFLSGHLDVPDGLLTHAVVAVADGKAVVLPPAVRSSLKVLQPHLRRVRWQLADVPLCIIDAEAGEIVVPEPALTIDYGVIEEIEAREKGSKEVPRVVPGRYPIAGWALPSEAENGALSRAMAVALSLPAVDDSSLGIEGTVEALATLFSRTKTVAVAVGKPKEMVNDLRAVLRL